MVYLKVKDIEKCPKGQTPSNRGTPACLAVMSGKAGLFAEESLAGRQSRASWDWDRQTAEDTKIFWGLNPRHSLPGIFFGNLQSTTHGRQLTGFKRADTTHIGDSKLKEGFLEMTKLPRMHIEGTIFYITSRGDNDLEIFKDEADKQIYISLLNKYKEHYGFKLWAYCLLENHLHLLLELKEGLTVSDVMHDLSTNYTKYFNTKYSRKGHLFRERYELTLAQKDKYLKPIIDYLQRTSRSLKTEIVSSAGAVQAAQPAVVALQQLQGIQPKASDETISNELEKQNILGDEEFIRYVKATANQKSAWQAREKNLKTIRLLRKTIAFTVSIAAVIMLIIAVSIHRSQAQRQLKEMDSYYKEISRTLQLEKQKVKTLQEKMQERGI